MQPHLRKGVFSLAFENLIVERSKLCALLRLRTDIYEIVDRIFPEIIGERSPFGVGSPAKDGEIPLFKIPRLQSFGEPSGRLGRLGVDHDTSRGPVQTVYEPRIRVSGLIVGDFQISFYLVQQIVISALVGTAGGHLRLQNDDDVIVFKQNFKGRTIVLLFGFSH